MAREGGDRPLLRRDLSDGDSQGLRGSPHQASAVLVGLRTTPAAPYALCTPPHSWSTPHPPPLLRRDSPCIQHAPHPGAPQSPGPGALTHGPGAHAACEHCRRSRSPPRVSSASSWPQCQVWRMRAVQASARQVTVVSVGGAASLALAAAGVANKDFISGTQSNTSMVRRNKASWGPPSRERSWGVGRGASGDSRRPQGSPGLALEASAASGLQREGGLTRYASLALNAP